MTTSGTTTFNYTRDQIIRAALRKIGAFASGETPDAQTITDCSDALNAMVKRWNTKGIHLWTESEAILFLQPGQVQYSLGTGSTDNATSTYTATTTSAQASLGASSITVASVTGIAATNNIGIVLNKGTIQWTTVLSVVGNTVNLNATLQDSVLSGNNVYVYTTAIVRPLRVPFARRYNIASAIDTPMIGMSRRDYRDLPNKQNSGIPTQFFYDPQLGLGQFFVWPNPPDPTNAIKFTWYRPIQDFNNPGDTPDLPQEWIDALIFNLAALMAPEYDVPPQRFQMIATFAASCLDDVMGWDREPESTYFGVNVDYRQ